MNSRTAGKTAAYLGIFATIAVLCGYVEMLIPFSFGILGIKLGLANVVTVMILYLFGTKEAALVTVVRIIIVSLLFANFYSLLYSLAGGALSLFCMVIIKKIKAFSMIGVSITGGVTHNIGQLIVAAFVVKELRIFYYAPALLIAGTVTGLLIGILANLLYNRVRNFGGHI